MADLPLDLVREISHRLHDAGDYVKFHAVCRAWRSSLPPSHCRPAFLPWLLSPRNASGHRTAARAILSSSKNNSSNAAVIDRRWVIRADGGAAACFLLPITRDRDAAVSGRQVHDPFTSSATAPLPPLPGEIDAWVKHALGTVAGDGTIFVLAISPVPTPYGMPRIKVATLHPGEAAWTLTGIYYPRIASEVRDGFCVAYGDGRVVMCVATQFSWSWRATRAERGFGVGIASTPADDDGDVLGSASYVVESGGQLLRASVRVDSDRHAVSVAVYALQEVGGGGGGGDEPRPRWVRTDGRRSLAGRVLFLGRPVSFAMDAAQLGMRGGCAYFVRRLWWESDGCCLLKYSFHDGESAELMAHLPCGWGDGEACMWLTPQPAIACSNSN